MRGHITRKISIMSAGLTAPIWQRSCRVNAYWFCVSTRSHSFAFPFPTCPMGDLIAAKRTLSPRGSRRTMQAETI